MMYGFGDTAGPRPETVAIVDDCLQEFVQNMVRGGGVFICI